MIMKTTIQNLWDATKAALRGKFIAMQAFFKKEERSQMENLAHHINEQKKKNKKGLKSAEGRKS